MIGNDLVDLKLANIQSNWQRKGFLDKLFTPKEQEYILNADNPFETVWLLWSMKESAYKAYLQIYGCRFFAPKKLACSLLSKNKGTVLINNSNDEIVDVSNLNKGIYIAKLIDNSGAVESRKLIIN